MMVSGLGISSPSCSVPNSYQDIDRTSPLKKPFKPKIPPEPNTKPINHSFKRKQTRKKRRKMSDSSSISASTSSSTAKSPPESVEEYIQQIVGRIFTKLYKHIDSHTPSGNYRDKHFSSNSSTVTIDTDGQDSVHKDSGRTTPSHYKRNTPDLKKNNRRKYKKPNSKPKAKQSKAPPCIPTCSSAPIVPTFSIDEFPPLAPEVCNLEYLDTQINKFISGVSNKLVSNEDVRYIVLSKVQEIVNSLYPTAQAHLYGSFATGLALPCSDMDIAILGSNLYGIKAIRYGIMELGRVIQYYPWVNKCAVIATASVPVIKLSIDTSVINGAPGEIHLDISFEDEAQVNSAGIASMRLTHELLILYPLLHPISLVVKQLLANNGLNSAYKGGISSYSLVIWIVSFINSLDEVPIRASDLLIQFLRFYGKEFDPLLIGINIRNGRSYFRLESSSAHAVTLDPLNQDVNTTRSSYSINKVLSLFALAHDKLTCSTTPSNLLESILEIRIT
jgi:DNA polymerase sigma